MESTTEFWIGPKESIEFEMTAQVQSSIMTSDRRLDERIDERADARIEKEFLVDTDLLQEFAKIPNKMAFKIGEVAELLDIKQYVLRYWETEFEVLSPKKSHHNQRMFTRKDVETAMMIKKLLYRDRFSIEGARKALQLLKGQLKREKPLQQMVQKYHSSQQLVEELLGDLDRMKELFS